MTPREFNEFLLKEKIFPEHMRGKLERLAELVYCDSFGKCHKNFESEVYQIKNDLLKEMKPKEKNMKKDRRAFGKRVFSGSWLMLLVLSIIPAIFFDA